MRSSSRSRQTRAAIAPARRGRHEAPFWTSVAPAGVSMSPEPRGSRFRSLSPVRASIPAAYPTTRRPLSAVPPVLYGTWSPSMPTFPPRGAAQVPLYASSSLLRGRMLPTRRSPVRMRLLSPPPRPETTQRWMDYVNQLHLNHELAGTMGSRQAMVKAFRTEQRFVSVPVSTYKRRQRSPVPRTVTLITNPRLEKTTSEMDKVQVGGWTRADDWNFGQVSPSRSRYATRSLSPLRRKAWVLPWAPETRSALVLNNGSLRMQVGGDHFTAPPALPLAIEQTIDRNLYRSLPSTRLSFDTPPRPRRSSSPTKNPSPQLLPRISPRKDRGPMSASMTLSLDLDYKVTLGGGPGVRRQFENDVISDLAAASGSSKDAFRITSVSPGSIIVVVDVVATPLRRGRSPAETVTDLVQQLRNPNSALLAGKITSKTKDLAPTDHYQCEIFDDVPLVGLDSAQPDFDAPVFTRKSHKAQRAAAPPTGEADNQPELTDYLNERTNESEVSGYAALDRSADADNWQSRNQDSNVRVPSAVDYSLPGEARASEPDTIEDPSLSFFDSIRQSPLISWLYPGEDPTDKVKTTPIEEAVLSSRGQVRESMPPSQTTRAVWSQEQQQIAQLNAQVAELQSMVASLTTSNGLKEPQSTPTIGSSMSRPLPRPASADMPNGMGMMGSEFHQRSPKYSDRLTLEDRSVDRPSLVSSPNSVGRGPASASPLALPPKSPSADSVYRIADRPDTHVGREYRAGPRLPPASGRITLEDRQERRL